MNSTISATSIVTDPEIVPTCADDGFQPWLSFGLKVSEKADIALADMVVSYGVVGCAAHRILQANPSIVVSRLHAELQFGFFV